MCFSATASFSIAGITAVLGIAALRQARRARELPLACFPLVFAAQQAVEGVITALAVAFLIFANMLWPALTPTAVFLIEPERRRRLAMGGLMALSLFVAGYLLYVMMESPYRVSILGGSLRYASDARQHLPGGKTLYAACTVLPLLLSSHRLVTVMGGIVAVGLGVSLYAYQMTFISVWCFFAATASVVLYLHFAAAEREGMMA